MVSKKLLVPLAFAAVPVFALACRSLKAPIEAPTSDPTAVEAKTPTEASTSNPTTVEAKTPTEAPTSNPAKAVEVKTPEGPSSNREVLPTNVVPTKYRLEVTSDLVGFGCSGVVVVDLEVKSATSSIVLNSKDLSFDSGSVQVGGKTLNATSVTFDTDMETASLYFASPLPLGKATLTIPYTFVLDEKLNGYHRVKYELEGKEKWMGTTQFEATHARQAFPCWDEPAIKAVFEIVLKFDSSLNALCNMPVAAKKTEGVMTELTFEETPIMSTYLLAWCIGDFECVEAKTKGGVTVRVYTQLGKTDQGQFGLECGVKILDFFGDFFGIAYPLPKLDMIAIPNFAAGAMENWGLVTYRETALLYDPKSSSVSAKQRVVYVVAHELAHQWFGNLVSPDWWSYLWLNEGFATWAGTLATDELFPDWGSWDSFVAENVTAAFSADGLASSHPIEVEVESAGKISEIFDAISYYKGSSAIRMLATYLGLDNFKQGLQTYMQAHKYSCATTEDLWSHLCKASGKDVPRVMDNWIKKTGYPYVTATLVGESNGTAQIQLSQRRFLASGLDESKDDTVWFCPVNLMVCKGPGEPQEVVSLELTERSQTFSVKVGTGAWWVKANTEMSAFYRVAYGEKLLARLVPVLSTLKSVVDRLSVQTDMYALAEAGGCTTAEFLEVAKGYRSETEQSIWSDLAGHLGTLRRLYALEGPDFSNAMKAFGRWLYTPIVEKLTWEVKADDNHATKKLRPMVLSAAGANGDKAVIAEAQKRFAAHIVGTAKIPSDLQSMVFSCALANGGEKEFDQLVELHSKAEMGEEIVRVLQSLGSSNVAAVHEKALEFALSGKVKTQNLVYVVAAVARNPSGRAVCWQWLQDKWATIVAQFGDGQFMLPRFIKSVCSGFTTEARLKEVTDFFADKTIKGAERALLQTKETIQMRIDWSKRDKDNVNAFFHNPSAPWSKL